MIHIVDDYLLLAGSLIAVAWGVASLILAPRLGRRIEDLRQGLLTTWIGRTIMILVTGLVILWAISTLGTENDAVNQLTMFSGLLLIIILLSTGLRVYRVAGNIAKFGVPAELLAGGLVLLGSFI